MVQPTAPTVITAPDSRLPTDAQARTAEAQQLTDGFRLLQFAPALEAEFLVEFQRHSEHRQRWLSLLLLLLWSAFAVSDPLRIDRSLLTAAQTPIWHELLLVRGGVLVFFLVATLLAWGPGFGRWQRHWLVVGALVLEICGAWGSTCYQRLGGYHVNEVLLLLVAGLFLPLGLTLRQTLPLAAGCLVGIFGIGLLKLDAEWVSRWLYLCLLMVVTTAVAAFGAYYREYAQREQFLLRAELSWQATHDFLTGLANRRMFDHHLRRLMRLAHRERQPLALVLVDVDWFKRFNDRYGHPAGDDALQQLSTVLAHTAARPLDLAARLGGEELALLIYGADAGAAHHVCNGLLASVRALAIAHADGIDGRLTISLGCGTVRADDTPERLFQRTDELLYAAKQGGRNRGCFDPATTPA